MPLQRCLVLLVFALWGGLWVSPLTASVAKDWSRAEASAQACDLAAARQFGESALDLAEVQWPKGQEGFFPLHYALASWSNAAFDYASGESHARSALSISEAAGFPRLSLSARARVELAHALVGLRRFPEAERQLDAALDELPEQGERETQLAIRLLRANLEFARGRVAAGAKAMEETGRLAGGDAQLGAAVALPLADARRRMFDFSGSQSALEQAQTASRNGLARISTARLLVSEAALRSDRGDFSAALEILQRAMQQAEDPCDPLARSDALFLEGQIHLLRREISDARVSLSEAIERIEALGLQQSPRYGETLSRLAVAVAMAGDVNDANRLFNVAAKAMRDSYGAVTSQEALVRLDQAYVLSGPDRSTLTIAMADEALKMLAVAGDASPIDNAYAEATMGHVLKDAGRNAEASDHFNRAIAIFETLRGRDSFDAAPGLLAMGEINLAEGALNSAEEYLERALTAQSKGDWSGAQAVGVVHSRLAAVHFLAGRPELALNESAIAVRVLEGRIRLGEATPSTDAEAERSRAGTILDEEFSLLEREAGTVGQFGEPSRIDRILLAGQLGASLRTGQAIAQMAQRLAAANDGLAELIRKRQDLAARLRADQQAQVMRLTNRPTNDVARGKQSDSAITLQELAVVSRQIETTYGKAALVLGSTLATKDEIAGKLDVNEAVMAIFVRERATFIVIIRKDQSGWYRVPTPRSALDTDVRVLRETLERRWWPNGTPPPFPLAVAAQLNDLLIAPAASLLVGIERMIIIPDGPLMSLPFSLLVSRPSSGQPVDETDYRRIDWLVRRYSIVTLPSLASFAVLRGLKNLSPADMVFLGVGDPILKPQVTSPLAGAAQLEELQITSVALNDMKRHFDGSRSKVLLRANASEENFRSSEPGRYAFIAFATHALVTGELAKSQEAALVLSTPPQSASSVPSNDGLLTASEVAALELHAQLVILLACNTAAGDGAPHAEPFTGLVKAFFYAGTQDILASHWAVEAEASTRLVQDLVANYRPYARKSDAWRKAQLSMIYKAKSSLRAHPHYWAAFQFVGVD